MSDTHDHSHAPANFNRAFAIGILLNIVFVAIEAFYGWRVNSLALLADAGHNLSDVAGLVLAWGGALAVKLRPNARHTYGWKRATILAAFANALLLLVAMGGLAWEAVGRLTSGEVSLQEQGVTICRARSSTAPTSPASPPTPQGVIQIFNVGAERMLGYTAADVMNKITPADISDPQE
jgi:Co/Zn/Cd efflux system component